MNTGKACAIIRQLDSDMYSAEEKITAIGVVAYMETHNSINKNIFINAIKWLYKNLINRVKWEKKDLIYRESVIDELLDWKDHSMTDAEAWHIKQVIGSIKSMPAEDLEPLYMAHYKQGREDEAAEREGRMMQAFSPD